MAGVNTWFDGDWSGDYAIELPADTPKREVALELACAFNGGTESDYTPEQIERLTNAVRYCPLFSVVARDREFLGDDVDWHSDASGKRVRQTWFMDASLDEEAI